MQDLIIIGGGPAGVAAGVYASRKQIKTTLITDSFGGQSIVSEGVENWIGDIKISGIDLAKKLENHLRHYAGEIVTIKTSEKVESVTKESDETFLIKTNKDEYRAKAVLVTTGSMRKKLPAKNADTLEHKGLTYCATCDGPMFSDQDVAVIGGGNSAIEGVAQLLAYAKSVKLIHRRDEFKADPVTLNSIRNNPKLEIITNAEVVEILGDKFVSGLRYKDTKTNEEKELALGGIFVEIGAVPATNFVSELVKLNEGSHIEIDPWTQRASVTGIWAAGDCTNVLYHQNNIAAGDAVKALEDIYVWLSQGSDPLK